MTGHTFLPGAATCTDCNTPASSPHQTACPGPQRPRPSGLLPEPGRRTMAADDIDTIHARMAELETERREALNQALTEGTE